MKKGKYTLIIIGLILIVLLIIWWITLKNKQESNKNQNNTQNNNENTSYNTNEEMNSNEITEEMVDPPVLENFGIELVTDRNMFYSVEQNISTYLQAIVDRNPEEIYNFLDEDYIEKFSVTKDNVLDKVENYTIPVRFSAQEMYQMINLDTQITTYYVKGFVEKQIMDDSGDTEEYYVTLNYDAFNKTFSIMPHKYMFANTINHVKENEQIKVTMKQYIAYMDRVEVTMTIENKSANQIDASNNAKLSFYEDGTNSDVISKNNEIVGAGASQDVTLTFSNNIKTPKNVTILGLEVPVIADEATKK